MNVASVAPKESGWSRVRKLSIGQFAPYLLASPTVIILLLFFVTPAVIFFMYSFWMGGAFRPEPSFTVANYIHTITNHVFWRVLLNSLLIGFFTAAGSTLLAYPLAYFLTYKLSRGKSLVLFMVVISLLSGYIVRVYAWKTILGRTGVLNSFLMQVGIIDEPLLFILFSRIAVIITLVNVFIPFTVLPILSSLANIPQALIEAARDLGAGPAKTFAKVTLPLSMTGVISGFMYAFILSAGDYITPELVGGIHGMMIGRSISNQFVRTGNWPLGSAYSFVVLSVFALLFVGIQRALKRIGLMPSVSGEVHYE